MKKITVALSAVAASVLMAMSAQAAEIYNKDGNKLDLYGKVNAKHYFSSSASDDGDKTYARMGFKGETQINDQLTGFGQWEYEFTVLKLKVLIKIKLVLRLQGFALAIMVRSTMVATTV